MRSAGSDMIAHWLEQAGRVPLLTPDEAVHLGGIVQAWQSHAAGPDGAPPVIRRRGLRARDRMVAANLRLVAHVARRARHGLGVPVRDSELPDLLQAGSIGLMRGVERFDPTRGYKLSTLAYWWIRAGFGKWAEKEGRTIKLPSNHAFNLGRMGRLTVAVAERLGRQPTRAEMAAELGMALADLDHLLLVGVGCHSLDAPVPGARDGEPSSLGDLTPSPQEGADPMRDELLARIEQLDSRAQRLIRAHYGIGEPETSVTELARREGVTIHRLRGLLRVAEMRLRRLDTDAPPLEPRCDGPTTQLSLWVLRAAAQGDLGSCSDDGLAAG